MNNNVITGWANPDEQKNNRKIVTHQHEDKFLKKNKKTRQTRQMTQKKYPWASPRRGLMRSSEAWSFPAAHVTRIIKFPVNPSREWCVHHQWSICTDPPECALWYIYWSRWSVVWFGAFTLTCHVIGSNIQCIRSPYALIHGWYNFQIVHAVAWLIQFI